MKLRDIAHVRSGDKGDAAQISVICYRSEDFPRLAKAMTTDVVAKHFAPILNGAITRYEAPQLGALVFVMEQALGGGVTRSLAIDPHGKALAATLLSLEI